MKYTPHLLISHLYIHLISQFGQLSRLAKDKRKVSFGSCSAQLCEIKENSENKKTMFSILSDNLVDVFFSQSFNCSRACQLSCFCFFIFCISPQLSARFHVVTQTCAFAATWTTAATLLLLLLLLLLLWYDRLYMLMSFQLMLNSTVRTCEHSKRGEKVGRLFTMWNNGLQLFPSPVSFRFHTRLPTIAVIDGGSARYTRAAPAVSSFSNLYR